MGAEEGVAEEEADGAAPADAAGPAQHTSVTSISGVGRCRAWGDLDALLDHHLRVGGVEAETQREEEDGGELPGRGASGHRADQLTRSGERPEPTAQPLYEATPDVDFSRASFLFPRFHRGVSTEGDYALT